MRTIYFDCFSGASGDMLLGALVDAGLDVAALARELEKLDLPGWRFETSRVTRSALAATKVDVVVGEKVEGPHGVVRDYAPPDHSHERSHEHHHDHAQHRGRDHDDHHDAGHAHGHDHGCDSSAWGHAHAPEPQELAGPGGWQRGLSAIVAVGLRPCSGAIIVLVFSLAQGLFWAGVVSTFIMGLGTAITVAAIAAVAVGAKAWARRFADARSGYGTLAMRGIEVAAAAVIIVFGALLLTGYMASERMAGM